jgi:hypothetical protein
MISRLPAFVLVVLTAGMPAQAPAQEALPAPLRFLGIEVGLPLTQLGQEVAAMGGKPLRCDRSRRDPSVHECRASVLSPGSREPLSLWASAIDSTTSILTLSGTVSGVQLSEWKTALESDYGTVGAQVQGSQWMMQWVRRGTMIRLTWRIENGAKVVSVSLVDGRILDAWGRRRFHEEGAPRRRRPAPPDSLQAPAGRR